MGISRKAIGDICGVCHVVLAPKEEKTVVNGTAVHRRCARQAKVPEDFLPTVYTMHMAVGMVPARCWLNDAGRSALWNKVHAITASLKTMFIDSERPTMAAAVPAVRSLYAALSKFARLLPATDDVDMNAGRMMVIDAMRKLHMESLKRLGIQLTLTKPVRDLMESNRRHRVEGTRHVETRLAILWANTQPV